MRGAKAAKQSSRKTQSAKSRPAQKARPQKRSSITANQRRGLRSAWTIEKRKAFLAALSECPIVGAAAKKAGVARSFVYEIRKKDECFAAEWAAALDKGIDALEDEAYRRAMGGTLRPIYYRGHKVGTVREFSDTLTIFLLKGNRPEKYRERHELSGPNGMPLIPATVQITLPDNGRNDAQPPGGGNRE